MVTNPPAMQETWVQSLGQEDPLQEEMATHSSILALEIPWTEERSLASYGPWGHKELDKTEQQTLSLSSLEGEGTWEMWVVGILVVTMTVCCPA